MNDPIWLRFAEVLRRNLSRNGDLVPDAPLADLGLDSMRAVDLLFDLESTFDVVFPDSLLTAETFASVGSLHSAIRKLAGNGTSP